MFWSTHISWHLCSPWLCSLVLMGSLAPMFSNNHVPQYLRYIPQYLWITVPMFSGTCGSWYPWFTSTYVPNDFVPCYPLLSGTNVFWYPCSPLCLWFPLPMFSITWFTVTMFPSTYVLWYPSSSVCVLEYLWLPGVPQHPCFVVPVVLCTHVPLHVVSITHVLQYLWFTVPMFYGTYVSWYNAL